MAHRIDQVLALADEVSAVEAEGDVLFAFLDRLAADAVRDQAFVEILAAEGIDPASTMAESSGRFLHTLNRLLGEAQRAGVVRDDIDAPTLKVLVSGYLSMARQLPPESGEFATIGQILRTGLAPLR